MIVFKILDTKDMMSHLLLKETFDNWIFSRSTGDNICPSWHSRQEK